MTDAEPADADGPGRPRARAGDPPGTQAVLDALAARRDRAPVLIAGPTASGKSALALAVARAAGGVVVNADALQVYDGWRLLTARPSPQEMEGVPHLLYGHVPGATSYSVGRWLREVAPLLAAGPRPVIVGGTGLYFTALTEGLAEIPPVPAAVRAEADALALDALRAGLDAATAARIDLRNRARVQRAWEVRRATGRGLADWQARTGPALLPPGSAAAFVLDPGREVLAGRIAGRFHAMLAQGVLDEVRAALPGWDPARPSARAIGAAELVAHLRGETSLEAASEAAISATRDYARRQRKWFRVRMKGWESVPLA